MGDAMRERCGLLTTLSGLERVSDSYDALICDVWGVVHDGQRAKAPACEALKKFRQRHGSVILVSNAPRPISDVKIQFARLGVPEECYDAIVTSGMAARAALARRAEAGAVRVFHLGPARDRGVFEGLPIEEVGENDAELVLCTGLFDDTVETPEAYRARLLAYRERRLPLWCANPDLVVQRGGELVYCAGALAKLYDELGGEVVYFGKPYRAIYEELAP